MGEEVGAAARGLADHNMHDRDYHVPPMQPALSIATLRNQKSLSDAARLSGRGALIQGPVSLSS